MPSSIGDEVVASVIVVSGYSVGEARSAALYYNWNKSLNGAGASDRRRGELDVHFRTDELRECAADVNEATKAFGRGVGRKYQERVSFLMEIESTHEIPSSWRFHPLRGDRKGQFAIDLNKDKGVRLVMTFPKPGLLRVEEVNTDHYD